MKKLTIILLSVLGTFILASCDKEEGPTAYTSNPVPPEISAPASGESYVLTQNAAEDIAMSLEWSEAGFNFRSAPTYSIQLAADSADAEYKSLASTNSTSHEVTVSDLNNFLLGEDYTTNVEHSLKLRVVASLGNDDIAPANSEPVSIAVTPYFAEVSYPEIYVPGGYQGASNEGDDWSPATAPALYSVNDDDTYEGYVNIADAGSEFKFTAERNWDEGDWGDDEGDGQLDPGGGNIIADEAGYYKINVDLNDLTYETLNTTWGLIGSATADGWDADQDMTYDPEEKVWTITTDLSAGEMKFRANDAWNLDYGDDEGDGMLDQGGGNIAVDQAGNYTVILDLSEAPYTYELNQN
jgi:hypothetical protein